MFAFHRALFPPALPSKEEHRRHKERDVRKLIGLFAQGNVCLQQGNFLTEKDISKLKEEVKEYDF